MGTSELCDSFLGRSLPSVARFMGGILGGTDVSVHIVGGRERMRDLFAAICAKLNYQVGQCLNELAALDDVAENDVVLLHSTCRDEATCKDITLLKSRFAHARVLVVTDRDVPMDVQNLLSQVSEAVLSEQRSADSLAAALTVVHEGYRLVRATVPSHPHPVQAKVGAFKNRVSDEDIANAQKTSIRLSARESAILQKLVDGGTNKDIANQLGICEATVKVHLRACYRKIGAKNRTQAAMWAAQKL